MQTKWLKIILGGIALLIGVILLVNSKEPQSESNFGVTAEDSILQAVVISQADYFQQNGRYWQGLKTSTEIPKDGVAITPDRLNLKPKDEPKAWDELVTLSTQLPYQVEVWTYGSGNDAGYQVLFRKQEGNLIYEKSAGYGYAFGKTYDWKVIQDVTPPATASTTP